eukprot:CAMPEP_0177635538 /NCGR_PEP_ID=MMETSP0447-20121125/3957_1 /TAXON_ID=0 /ORGANISM="Stygamoeba regulata, Strain BSH-02190019" /LENGTH=321 /DNA_ID=CAMNT_0019137337 /DNA_START=29 /DNA_END=990 /DNA_ORIENTATION=+
MAAGPPPHSQTSLQAGPRASLPRRSPLGPPGTPPRSLRHIRTKHQCSALRFCPFPQETGSRVALATSQHFGIVGNGELLIVDVNALGVSPVASFDTLEGIFDCAWSEQTPFLVVIGGGGGACKLYDIRAQDGRPLREYRAHSDDISSVDWNLVTGNEFLSSSWDGCIGVWDPMRSVSPIQYIRAHSTLAYAAVWSPVSPRVLASVGGEGSLKVWDLNEPSRPAMDIAAHDNEVLTVDWNKYDPSLLITGSVDRLLRVWDIRSPHQPMITLHGHKFGVRKVKFSPHRDSVVVSAGYDMTTLVWDLAHSAPLLQAFDHHSEFV